MFYTLSTDFNMKKNLKSSDPMMPFIFPETTSKNPRVSPRTVQVEFGHM